MKRKIIFLLMSAVGVSAMSFSILSKTGRAGVTGSPNETTCNTSNCHTGNAVNSPGGSITITCPTLTNWQYTPGQTYAINVTVARTNVSLFGLGFEALTSTGTNGGTLTAGAANQTLSTLVSGNSRTSITHTGTGNTGSGTYTFTFTWKAPATNIGNVTFYCAGNAANSNSTSSGDFIYTASQVVTPVVTEVMEEALTKQLTIFPNPATDYLQITSSGKQLNNMSVMITDVRGTVVKEKQTINTNDFIELSNLESGSYLLHIETNGKAAVKKFIKQ